MARSGHGNGLDSADIAEKLTYHGNRGGFVSDPGTNGSAVPEEKQVDKYGFTGGAQQSHGAL